jgi:hypothetical protein
LNTYYNLPMVVFAALVFSPAVAGADYGGVALTNGGRLNGQIMSVQPADHVLVLLADGTSHSVPWREVVRIYDGARVYEADGSMHERAAPPEDATTLDVPRAPRPGATEDMRLLIAYEAMPTRAPTAFLYMGGTIFMLNGFALTLAGAIIGCFGDCGFSRGMIGGGVTSMAMGGLMFYGGSRRARARARVLRELLGVPEARPRPRRELSFGGRMDREAFIPSLTLSF